MAFKANNDLEELMLSAQEGEIDLDEFMSTLLDSQLFMPVRDKINLTDIQGSTSTVPLSLEDEKGTKILVVFTSQTRAHEFLKDKPDYQDGMTETFAQLLQMNGVGYGVTINPGEEVGMDFEPDTVEQIVRLSQAVTD